MTMILVNVENDTETHRCDKCRVEVVVPLTDHHDLHGWKGHDGDSLCGDCFAARLPTLDNPDDWHAVAPTITVRCHEEGCQLELELGQFPQPWDINELVDLVTLIREPDGSLALQLRFPHVDVTGSPEAIERVVAASAQGYLRRLSTATRATS